MRSQLGSHVAGTGVNSPTAQQFDDFIKYRGIKFHKPGMLPTDQFRNDKEGKKAFDEYCKEQSSDVVTYTLDTAKKREL